MKPFVLKQHDKDRASIRELRDSELKHIAGGAENSDYVPTTKLSTTTVTPRGSKDDGADEG